MIVEVLGLPGVGKTTFVEELLSNSDNINSPELCKSNITRLSRAWHSLVFLAKFIYRYPNAITSLTTQFRWLVFKMSYRYQNYARQSKSGLCILQNNGVLMPIVSFIVQRNNKGININFNKLIRLLPMPDVIILVTSSIGVNISRYSIRGGILNSRHGYRNKVVLNEKLFCKFNEGRLVIEEIVSFAKLNGSKIIKIDNEEVINNKDIINRVKGVSECLEEYRIK